MHSLPEGKYVGMRFSFGAFATSSILSDGSAFGFPDILEGFYNERSKIWPKTAPRVSECDSSGEPGVHFLSVVLDASVTEVIGSADGLRPYALSLS